MEKTFNTANIEISHKVDYRDLKYPSLEFKTGNLLLFLPKNHQNETNIIKKYAKWIENKNLAIRTALKEAKNKKLELNRTDESFRDLVKLIAEKTTSELNVTLNQIYFKKMKSKWGSCSKRKNLMINTTLKYLPTNLIEYVVFHEITHLKEKRHNENFWQMISKKFENYGEMEKNLFIYWFLIQQKQKGGVFARYKDAGLE